MISIIDGFRENGLEAPSVKTLEAGYGRRRESSFELATILSIYAFSLSILRGAISLLYRLFEVALSFLHNYQRRSLVL